MSTIAAPTIDSSELKLRVRRFQEVESAILREVRKAIVGQDEVIDQVLISLFVGGHCLITGMPGTAKTLLVRTMAQTLGLVFKRIQFTPDLMPSDITGTDIIEEDPGTGRRTWTFVPGPIFCNVLLADEINRTPPKTQSALLEAIQELSCTVRGHIYKIEAPDFVKKYVNFGASVRATQFLVLAAKARALMRGRYHVAYEDIRALALPILRHRVLLNFHAESERMSSDDILKKILEVRPAQ